MPDSHLWGTQTRREGRKGEEQISSSFKSMRSSIFGKFVISICAVPPERLFQLHLGLV